MKKALFLLLAAFYCYGTMCFQTFGNDERFSNASVQDEEKTVSTFYGSKVSSNANNPCKGATTRVCGKIETELITVNSGQTSVYQKVTDAEGVVLSSSSYFVAKPLKEVKEEIELQTFSLGGTLENNVGE